MKLNTRLRKGKDHLSIDNALPAVSVLSKINPIHATTFHFLLYILILLSIYNCAFPRWGLFTINAHARLPCPKYAICHLPQ
jgi:hypothetical protein